MDSVRTFVYVPVKMDVREMGLNKNYCQDKFSHLYLFVCRQVCVEIFDVAVCFNCN